MNGWMDGKAERETNQNCYFTARKRKLILKLEKRLTYQIKH